MTELIKKYSILLVVGKILSYILAGIILIIFPYLMTSELPNGGTSTLSRNYLSSSIEYLINIAFIFFLLKDMEKENSKSKIILIMTFFSAFIGVLFFLLSIKNYRINLNKD
jgi:hypothetical protein